MEAVGNWAEARAVGNAERCPRLAGEEKFWLTPSVHLDKNVGLSGVQTRQAQAIVEAHIKEIHDAWNRHFGR